MQQSNPGTLLMKGIQNEYKHLKVYQEEIVRPLGHLTFQSRALITFYDKIAKSKQKEVKSKSLIFVSEILNWNMPRFVTFVHGINFFIAHENIKQSKKDINKIKEGFSSEEEMLQVPLIFLKEKLCQIVKECEKWNRSQSTEKNAQQAKFLQKFHNDYLKCIQQFEHQTQKTQDEIYNLVLKSQYPPPENFKSKSFYLQKVLLLAKLNKKTQKAKKKLHDRKMRLQQLISGEKNYIKKLEDYIQHVKKPIQALDILSKDQRLVIFSTIQSILNFHKQFCAQLQLQYQKHDNYTEYGDLIRKYISFFQIYQQYILYAAEAEKKLLELQEENEQVEEICRKFFTLNKISAVGVLKEPTFRIAKYEMTMDAIIKDTNPIYADYNKLKRARKQFTDNLKKINNKVDSIIRRNRLNQLEQEFGTQENPIFAQNRQFMDEFNLFLIKEEKLQPVVAYIFNDFILVIDEHTKKKLKKIMIDETFYVRREEDNKTYRNIIKVHSDGFTTFSAGNEEKHFKKAEEVYELLQKITKINEESARLIYVQVIGTQEIGSTSFAKHTQYIIELKFLGMRKYLHLRFSEMSPILKKMKEHYASDFGITSEEDLRKNWFNNHKSKIIEDRKRTLQQILQKMLNSDVVKKEPSYLLNELGIDQTFLQVMENPKDRRESFLKVSHLSRSISSQSQSSMLSKRSKKEFKEPETILCATEIKLGRELYHDPDEALLEKKKTAGQRIDIYVQTMVNEEPITVRITEFNTVEDVCIKVSKLIGLRMNKDFRLFHEIGKKELRVLDHEQKIMKIFHFPKNQVKMNGFFAEIAGSFKKIFAPDTHPTLIFKKYYFLPIQIQQSENKKDLTRLRLLVYQIFAEIKDMKYQLSFDQYLLFLAMIIYIEHDGEVPEQVNPKYVNRVIPETIFKLKNYSEEEWIAKCRPHISRLRDEILKIIEYNKEQLKNKKIKADSVSKTALYFGHRHLCSQIVINKIRSNPIFGSNLFYVQPYKATYDKLVDCGKKMAYNMWLAIKVQSLNLLTPSSKETVLELKYKDIQKIFVYSEAIIFKMDGLITEQYRLNTYQSFQISQLVKYNRALNDTLMELQRDEDLIEKARLYKQELLIYRNTYDEKKDHA